jgi:glycosyltransferase involved in cell wall biosynthesis
MLTYITTYYDDDTRNEAKHLERLLKQLKDYNNPNLKLIVVDDASPNVPAKDVIAEYKNDNITLFRVTEDIGFNSHGARNLAMQHTTTKWNLLVDNDNMVVGLDNIFEQLDSLEEDKMHFFPVVHKFSGQSSPTRPSVNDFLITKKLFWLVEGYDSELFGFHIGDQEFLQKVNKIRGKQYSVIYGSEIHALESPFADNVRDNSIGGNGLFYDRINHKLITTDEHIDRQVDAKLAAVERIRKKQKNVPITFKWELVNFNPTEE